MAAAAPPAELENQISTLLSKGPEKVLASPRLVRIYLNGHCLCSTTSALYVWEKPWYPWYYVPRDDILPSQGKTSKHVDWEAGKELPSPAATNGDASESAAAAARFWQVSAGGSKATGYRIVEFLGGKAAGVLSGYVKVEFGAVDQWFEEDMPIHVHPKDPFKRVDVLPSSRQIRVSSLDGVLLADAKFSMHLFETGLPTRFYLPVTAINTPRVKLTKSETRTACPYKGIAEYYNVLLTSESGESQDTLVGKDLIWYYNTPNLECAGIAGMACFYNEKVQIEVDGVRWERPKTHFV